jgi:hypothetical protein
MLAFAQCSYNHAGVRPAIAAAAAILPPPESPPSLIKWQKHCNLAMSDYNPVPLMMEKQMRRPQSTEKSSAKI